MGIKYEAVFGPQELFDGMMGACEFASEEYGYKFANGALYYCERYNEKAGWSLSCKSHLTFKPSAMRRIIRTPEISGDIDDLIKDEFYEWWEKEGCLVRSGGGDYERTFAFAAFRKLMPEILAARGLKKTPTWTVADQKAGKLPEVGCEVINTDHSISLYVLCKVIYVDDKVVIVYNGELSQTYSHKAFLVAFNPIESPEEKAARLREEWCSNALGSTLILSGMKEYDLKRLGGYIGNIYDALLSGDLPVPVKGE